ncbi:hypothetical protein [Carnobacterium sp.]|uniref:hypothetical protein n=1 Tax=Carnobacterium sp. TaxID=48221 RepID=UPI0028B1EAE6|nr:hypothetical protein [Carnobacterium sp.]
MKPIKIATDSTVHSSKEEQEKYEITIIFLIAMVEEELYYDPNCKKMLEHLILPKTVQPAVGKFADDSLNLGSYV